MRDDEFNHVFPQKYMRNDGPCGLTKREYYAAAALQGLTSHIHSGEAKLGIEETAVFSVALAEALIKALKE